MAQANFFAPGFDDQIEAQNIERQRRYADLLREQSQQQPQGQMVSGHFVAPSWTQQLAQVLKAYQGGKGSRDADERQKALAEAVRGRTKDEMTKFTGLMSGAPAQATGQQYQTGANEMGDEAATVPQWQGAQKPDINAAYQFAAGAKTPVLQQAGMTGAMQMAQERAKREQALAEQQRMLELVRSSGSPQAAIAAGAPPELVKQYYEAPNIGREKVKYQDVGGKLVPVTEYGDQPQNIAPLNKTGNPFSDLVVAGPNGQMVPNAPLVGVKTGLAHASKPQISVDARNFNTQESEQSKVYGKQLGEIRGNITQAGFDAPRKIQRLDRMQELLAGVDGGKFAPLGADVASAATSLGIKIDPKLGNKQAAEALAVEMALDMKKPGSGSTSDKDMDEFIKTVPGLAKTPEGRALITQTVRKAIQRDVEAAKFSRDYAKQNGGVIDDNYFDAMANFYAKNPVVTPQMPATNSRGRSLSPARSAADAIINGGR